MRQALQIKQILTQSTLQAVTNPYRTIKQIRQIKALQLLITINYIAEMNQQ
jgi:hypothetical protein